MKERIIWFAIWLFSAGIYRIWGIDQAKEFTRLRKISLILLPVIYFSRLFSTLILKPQNGSGPVSLEGEPFCRHFHFLAFLERSKMLLLVTQQFLVFFRSIASHSQFTIPIFGHVTIWMTVSPVRSLIACLIPILLNANSSFVHFAGVIVVVSLVYLYPEYLVSL